MAKNSSTNSNNSIDEKVKKASVSKTKKSTKKSSGTKRNSKSSKKKTATVSTNKKKKSPSSKTSNRSRSKNKVTKNTSKKESNIREEVLVDSKNDSLLKDESSKKENKIDKNIRDDIIVSDSKKKANSSKKSKSDSKKIRDDIIVSDKGKKETKLDEKDSKKNIRDNIEILSGNKRTNSIVPDVSSDNGDIKEENLDKIANELEEDITNGKYIEKAKILIQKEKNEKNKVKRKRKGKNKYVIDLEATKEYKNLERDLRSLYDKTNDIIDEIDTKDVDKEVTVIEDLIVSDTDINEKKGLLDYISQKVLNVIILFLSIIFCILLVGVICFIIYVSTV